MAGVQPSRPTAVGLLKMIAVICIHQEVSEIGKEIEVVVKPIGHHFCGGVPVGAVPLRLQAVTLRTSAGTFVQRAEERHKSIIHGALRHLVARVPFAMITARRDAEAIAGVALAVSQNAVELLIIIRPAPWAIVMEKLDAKK